jgi:general secretion pathway protein D
MNRLWMLAVIAALIVCLAGARVHAADGDDSADSGGATAASADTGTDGDAVAGPDAEDGPPGVAAESSSRASSQDLITMNFQNVDIPVLAKFISEITGKNFVLDESVRGKVSIISPTKVTPDQAYSIFQSVLQIKGFTTVTAGSIIKIIPARDVRQSAELTTSQQPGETHGDQYVTRMVRLENADAGSVMSVIQPMVSHDGLIAAFPQDNTLIITDDAFNVQRLLRIIGSLDVQSSQHDVAVIPLKMAYADDLSTQIEKIMSAREGASRGGAGNFIRPGIGVVAPSAQGASTNFSVVPDERTNSLIVLASPLEMRQIRDLVAKLDIRSPTQNGRLHVYHLKYAPASEMVEVLDGLLGGSGGPSTLSPATGKNSLGRGSALGNLNGSSFGGGFGGLGNSSGGGFGGESSGGMGGGSGGFGGMGGGLGSASGGFGGSSGGSRGGAASSGPMTASTGGGHTADFSNEVNITADPATNSLIISAAPQDYETLQSVIDQLDIPRVQVFVQAIIVEVSVQRTKEIGVNFQTATGISNSVLGIGQLNFGTLQNAIGNPLGLTGLGLGLASGSQCSIPVSSSDGTTGTTTSTGTTVTAPCDVALMTALQTDTHSNVLSAPTLLTADNEEAMIVVGQNVPFLGSASASSALSGQIFNSVDRQNVGITLDIVPQVSQGEYVKLDLYEEVSNVVNGTQNNSLGPTTTIRSASTTVLVQNHRTAVIGGLISSDTENGRQGVPFLSDIPVLGNLFSDNSHDAEKQNLLVFLTPHIVRTRDDLQSLALDERQKFVRALGRTEVNNMPTGQFEQLYQPTFNRAISPQRDLQQYQGAPSGPANGGYAPSASAGAPSFTSPTLSPPSIGAVSPGYGSSLPPVRSGP